MRTGHVGHVRTSMGWAIRGTIAGAIALVGVGLFQFAARGREAVTPMTTSTVTALSQHGIAVTPAADASAVSVNTAVEAALASTPLLSTASSSSATLVMFSDTQTGTEEASGNTVTPSYTNREAWAITFLGAQIPFLGAPVQGPGAPDTYTANAVVFIDARTGSYLDSIAWAAN
jgi:hypothetical protein